MGKIWGNPFFSKLSTKMVAGFIAVVAIFATLGFIISHEAADLRSASDKALQRSEAVQHLQQSELALADQVQDQYELIVENDLSKVADFLEARSLRQGALSEANAHAETAQEQELLARMEVAANRFDDLFINSVVPEMRAGDPDGAIEKEKQADEQRNAISNYNAVLAASFNNRNQQAQAEVEKASSGLRSYFLFTALLGLSLSLLITITAARRLSRPVQELKDAAAAMVAGDLERRVQVNTHDEIAELGHAFNRMADAVQHEIEQLNSLSDIALAISSELNWEQVIDTVMDKGLALTESQAAAVVLYDEEKQAFADTYTKGLSDEFVSRMQFREGGLADECLLGDSAVFSDDLDARHRLSDLARREGIRAFICLPLKVRKKRLGVFYVYSKEVEAYGRDELSVLTILSNQAAIAIQNAQMLERSQEEAVTDGLTGLYNQRFFYSRLEEEMERSSRNQKPVSVIFCDLDRFKSFNDINGHALGDMALREVSRLITESKRAIDIAARYGGEEFALILPETDSSGAQIIAHRIRRRIAGFSFESRSKASSMLTASVGLAGYPNDGQQANELVDKADWSMYFSKRQGGNRVTLFHEESGAYERTSLEDLVREELHLAAVQVMAASVDESATHEPQHAESVARLASSIAASMKMDEEDIHRIRVAGLLHDVGLVGIPEEIINKRGSLTAEEWRRIKEHPEVSEAILKHISSLESFLPVVRHHHEHYDGAGYPDGLSGNNIPKGARIIAVADAFQAMTADRPYRKAMTVGQALTELQLGAGTQFDPDVVAAFIAVLQPSQAKAS
ncbi:phytochrome-like protein cph2 [bacterium BMS3Abin01]|nr:phytochrome-like protein cph2 [bacterium BMS3Abin01]